MATQAFKKAVSSDDPNYRYPPERYGVEDEFLADFLVEQGFGDLPDVISKQEIDHYVKFGEIELFRGLKVSEDYCEQFKYGRPYAGIGLYGKGIYTAYGANGFKIACEYGRYILRMCLKINADIIPYELIALDFEMAREAIDEEIDRLESNSHIFENRSILARKKDYKDIILSDIGRFAASLGYDGIAITGQKYLNLLNRAAVRVQRSNLYR